VGHHFMAIVELQLNYRKCLKFFDYLFLTDKTY